MGNKVPTHAVIYFTDGTQETVTLKFKNFSTGSRGYHGQEKIDGDNGVRWQTQVQLTEIGSKNLKLDANAVEQATRELARNEASIPAPATNGKSALAKAQTANAPAPAPAAAQPDIAAITAAVVAALGAQGFAPAQ